MFGTILRMLTNRPSPNTFATSNPATSAGPSANVEVAPVPVAIKVPPARLQSTPWIDTAQALSTPKINKIFVFIFTK